MKIACLAVAAALVAAPAFAQTYDGDWSGALAVPDGRKLRVELHVRTEAGATSARLDSLDQGISMDTTLVKTDGGEFVAAFIQAGAELKGRLSADGRTLDATWNQNQTPLPFVLTRAPAKTAP